MAESSQQNLNIIPSELPKINIIDLAQKNKILRAERETDPHGIPVFITQEGWQELMKKFGQDLPPVEAAQNILLPALEKITQKLLSQAAQETITRQEKKNKKNIPSVFVLETDLFLTNKETHLVLVSDKTHPVACALIGTPTHLSNLLSPEK